MKIDIAPLLELSAADKLSVMDELWESLDLTDLSSTIPQWHLDELDRRFEAEGDNPPGRPWREVIDELRTKNRP